jgi:peptidoglycan/LPS O-acetylase OafA/YrhL
MPGLPTAERASASADIPGLGPSRRQDGTGRDLALEGLRGAAALVVFYHHLMLESVGGWSPSPAWTWGVSGPAAVLIFFVLSGYVIGSRYRAQPDAPQVRRYVLRRAVRLVPINCFAVLLACAVATSLDPATVLGNVLFLQNFADYSGHWILVLRDNYNLWSLNYEVLFYGLFVVLWWPGLALRWVVGATLAAGVLGWFSLGLPLFLACYAFGFCFWLAGLGLAWHSREAPAERANWPTCLLLALITWKLQPLAEIMIALGQTLPRFAGPVVKLYHLDFLPVCVWLVAAVARRTFRSMEFVRLAAALIPLAGIAWAVVHRRGEVDPSLQAIFVTYGVALALWRWQLPVAWWKRLAPVGAISYALYATARPIEIGVFRLGQVLPATLWGFAVCALSTITIALGVAWYLERRIQPAITSALITRR